MSQVFDACNREERENKTYWNQVGLTMIQYEKDGETRYMLKDARNGQTYSLFPRKVGKSRRTNEGTDEPW